MKKQSLPEDTIEVTTYRELTSHLEAFKRKIGEEKQKQIWIVGPAGTGKSRIVKKALSEIPHYFVSGSATSAKLYEELFRYRDLPVVFDDLSSVYRNRELMSMLRNLCDTDEVKVIHRIKMRKDNDPLPDSFSTKSPVIIITNQIEIKKTLALCSRFTVLHFNPSVTDILNSAEGWFKDEEIKDFIEDLLPYVKRLNFRKLNRMSEFKEEGIRDWRTEGARMLGLKPNIVLMIQLLSKPFSSKGDRIREFNRLSTSDWYSTWDRLPLGLKQTYACP